MSNQDLWEQLDSLAASIKSLSWHYVRGHNGSPGNERCDEIAVAFSHGEFPELYAGPLSGYRHDLLDLPEPEIKTHRPAGKRRKTAPGTYISLLDGRLERHSAWSECQARVHGKSGAKFKKVSSPEEEAEVLRRWGLSQAP